MNEEKNKSIVKKESALVKRLGEQISITNKLLIYSFDYIDWWNNLDEKLKLFLRLTLALKVAIANHPEESKKLSKEDIAKAIILKKNVDFGENVMSVNAIKYLLSWKSIPAHALNDLEPVHLFSELEQLTLPEIEVKDLAPLNSLKQLKLLDISKAIVNEKELEVFKRMHPECKIIANELLSNEVKEKLAKEYFEKGNQFYEKGDFKASIFNYTKAIELIREIRNEYSELKFNALKNRAKAKSKLSDEEGAKRDLMIANIESMKSGGPNFPDEMINEWNKY
ncbi:MAG TPA: hypothetical protein VI757_12485 [Bacteroidia bacterium]|nr:hypothetical protein [Bacteroidia bacterium]